MRRLASIFVALTAILFATACVARAEGLYKQPRIASPQAFAETPSFNWAGVYFDLGAGGQAALMDLSASHIEGPSANLNGLGAWDFVGNARVGLNFQASGSPLVFGLFAGYSLGSVSVDGNVTLGQQSAGLSAEITPTWDVGAIIGLVGPNKSLFYGGPRFQMADFDLRGTGQAQPLFAELCKTSLRCSDELQGYGFVIGMKMPVTAAFVWGVEYGYTQFDTVNLSKIDNLKLNLEPEVHTVMLRGSIHIGPTLFGK